MTGKEEIQLPDGSVRRLGNKLPDPSTPVKLKVATYGDTPNAPMIPRDQWKPIKLDAFVQGVKDQDGIGACNCFDTCSIVEIVRAMQGLPHVELSPGYLYGNINGGVDEGSTLEDAMHWMMEHGTCSVSTVPALDWKSRPEAAAGEAQKYRVLEVLVCPTFDHMASALQSGFVVSSGLLWYNNYNPDGDGWLPQRGRGQAGGHAVARTSLVQKGGVWGLGGPNSWGTVWGVQGFMVIPEPCYSDAIGGFWCVRQAVDEGGIVPTP
jgi:hypothetical protein